MTSMVHVSKVKCNGHKCKGGGSRGGNPKKKKGDIKFDAKTAVLDPERKYSPPEYHVLQAKGHGDELHQLCLEHQVKQQISGVSLSELTEAEKQRVITLAAAYIGKGGRGPSQKKS